MARGLAAWAGGAVLLCVLLGAVYLPPRGMPKWAEGRNYLMRENNPQRDRARRLASEWQVANAALLGAEYHDRVGAALSQRRARNQPGPVLDLQAPDSVTRWGTPIIQGAFDSAWKRLDIGVSKISVGVLMRELPRTGAPLTPKVEYNRYRASYLLPDSTDRASCLVVAVVPYFASNRQYQHPDRLIDWASGVLGPCAWYARFGVPSPRVEQWLAARQFDVALAPVWYREAHPEASVNWVFGDEDHRIWWWGSVYSHPYQTMACFAGRPEACRLGLARYDLGGRGAKPRVVVPYDPWETNKVKLIAAQAYLSDLFRRVGDERFQRFWTTSLPVDSALTLALGQPVGKYTVSWLRSFSMAPRFGAGTTWVDAALGIAFAAVLVGLALFGQGRREVR